MHVYMLIFLYMYKSVYACIYVCKCRIYIKFADEFNPSRQVFLCVYMCSYLCTCTNVCLHVYMYVKIGYISNLLMTSILRARYFYVCICVYICENRIYIKFADDFNSSRQLCVYTCIYESCHTNERGISHMRMSHVTHMNESCHTYE